MQWIVALIFAVAPTGAVTIGSQIQPENTGMILFDEATPEAAMAACEAQLNQHTGRGRVAVCTPFHPLYEPHSGLPLIEMAQG